jgi:hypothetical protein
MKVMKILAISYLIKTLLVGVAWLFIPDLPQRATALFQRMWNGTEAAAPLTPTPAAATAGNPKS